MTYHETKTKILNDPGAHYSLKFALLSFHECDPVDALHDAASLAALMELRVAEIQAPRADGHVHEYTTWKSGVQTCPCGAFKHAPGGAPILEIPAYRCLGGAYDHVPNPGRRIDGGAVCVECGGKIDDAPGSSDFTVRIEVYRGVATCTAKPDDVEVEIVDRDEEGR